MPVEIPTWAQTAAERLALVTHDSISRFPTPPADARPAAVLVVLRDRGEGPETVLVTRSSRLRAHAGQVAFPGGGLEATDDGPVAAALREAAEETTLSVAHLQPLAVWPQLWIPVSGYAVTPVFAWCADEADIHGRDGDTEIVSAHMLKLSHAAQPPVRRVVRYPNGATGPAFDVAGLFVWGFTGLVLDRMLHVLGVEQPWDASAIVDLPHTTPAPPDSLGPRDGNGEAS